MILRNDSASTLPAILNIPTALFHQFDAQESGGTFGSYESVIQHIEGLWDTSPNLVKFAGDRLNLYIVDDLKPNAVFSYGEHSCEIGFSVTLRDILLTTSLFITGDSRLLSHFDIEGQRYRHEYNFEKFDVPIGFQDVARYHGGQVIFGIPPDRDKEYMQMVEKQTRARLYFAQVLRLFSELTVWFHELAHWIRLHLKTMQALSSQQASVTEVPTKSPNCDDETSRLLWRCIEHDADMYSFVTMLKLINDHESPISEELSSMDRSTRLFFLFLATNIVFSTISISQTIQNTDLNEYYPSVFERQTYLFGCYLDHMDTSEADKKIFSAAIYEWQNISNIIGWGDFIRKHNRVFLNEQSNSDKYNANVERIRKQIDRGVIRARDSNHS